MNQPGQPGDLFAVSTETARVRIETLLSHGGRRDVTVALTRNRRSMASVRFLADGQVRVRLHEAFAEAPDAVLRALRTYLWTHRRKAWRVVADFAQGIPPAERAVLERVRGSALATRGRTHDLAPLLAEVNDRFFQGKFNGRITWGRRSAARRPGQPRRSICFGSWDDSARLIRINPVLDDVRVEREFLRYIVFHEALHGVVPVEIRGGRRYRHGPHFRHFERQYPDLPRMRRLARDLLRVL